MSEELLCFLPHVEIGRVYMGVWESLMQRRVAGGEGRLDVEAGPPAKSVYVLPFFTCMTAPCGGELGE